MCAASQSAPVDRSPTVGTGSDGRAKGVWAAVKADTLSILAFQLGLFLGMWVYQELIFSRACRRPRPPTG
ncbi:hypothetical protein ACWEL8_09195 [Streptomyces sp. NPDC004690]